MHKTVRLFSWLLATLALTAASAQSPGKEKHRIDGNLQDLAQPGASAVGRMAPAGTAELEKAVPYMMMGDRVLIDVTAADGNGGALLEQLKSMGLVLGSAWKGVVSGYFPIDRLADLDNMSAVAFARASLEPSLNTGITKTQGDRAQRSDVARSAFGITGSRSKIGILSDSYNSRGGAAAGIASGDLPATIDNLLDLPANQGSDEGRAMAEIVHDIAPGAGIAFHTAFTGIAGFANGIRALADAGCNIIVDDVIYFAEQNFQDGLIAQAVDDVASRGVLYFSSAGNAADRSFESEYRPSGQFINWFGRPAELHDFGGGQTRIRFNYSGTAQRQIRLSLQWDDPSFSVSGAPGAATDLDLVLIFNNTIQLSLSSFADNIGADPFEFISVNAGGGVQSLEFAIVKYEGPNPGRVKLIEFGTAPASTNPGLGAATLIGHMNAAGAIATGAAAWFNTPIWNPNLTRPLINNFSAKGGTPILIDPAGNRIEPVVRMKPEFVGPDGGNTTFFGQLINLPGFDTDNFPNFFGTSASAPHLAAGAALLQDVRNGRLSRGTLEDFWRMHATDMDDPTTPGFDEGFDFRTGWGFVDVFRAVNQAPNGPRFRKVPEPSAQRDVKGMIVGEPDATVFPNPARGSVTLMARGGINSRITATILNSAGQVLGEYKADAAMIQRVSTSTLGKGMMMVRFNIDGQSVVRRFMVLE